MASHRHWALLVTARPGSGNGVCLAEVQMRSTSGGANIATGGTAGGASTFGLVPANAFDADNNTIWHNAATGGLPVRLSYDFGSAVDVVEIVVRNPPAGSTTGLPGSVYGPAACWIQWSDDGVNWSFGGPASDLSVLGDAASATILGVNDTLPGTRLVGAVARLSPGAAVSSTGRRAGGLTRFDSADGGPFRVAGTVKIDGTPATPVARRVRLFDVISGRLVREAWSGADGAFLFEKIRAGEYLVVSDDYTRTYNAVVADRVSAVL